LSSLRRSPFSAVPLSIRITEGEPRHVLGASRDNPRRGRTLADRTTRNRSSNQVAELPEGDLPDEGQIPDVIDLPDK
jgi:hypothetical protein